MSAKREVWPCALKLDSRRTSSTICQKASTSSSCRMGMATTTAQLAMSETTLTRLSPRRSTSGPPRMAGTTQPIAMAAPVTPTSATEPVVSSTSHGTATAVIMFPTCDTAFAAIRAVNERRSGIAASSMEPKDTGATPLAA